MCTNLSISQKICHSILEWLTCTWVQVILFEIDFAIFYTNLHEFYQFISWTNWVNSGKSMVNCWISCKVMADMEKFYKDLIIINLLRYHHSPYDQSLSKFAVCCSSIMLNCNRHLLATFREQVQSVQLTSLHFKTTIFESERVDFNASKCFFPEKYPLPILYRCYAGTPLPCMTGQRTIPHWATEILLRKEMGPFVWYYFLSIYLLQTSYVVV